MKIGICLCDVMINSYSYNKIKEMHQFFKIYFRNRTLHISDGFSVHHHESRIYHDARSSECQIRQCQTNKRNVFTNVVVLSENSDLLVQGKNK